MNAFWQALSFLTRFPVPKRAHTLDGWEKSPRYYPLVGLFIGAFVWLVVFVAEAGFGPSASLVVAAAGVVGWVYATGALHLDGWMDLADGLGSRRSREKTLEIMKDSRVGAMGAVAAIALLLLKVAAVSRLAETGGIALVVVIPAMARFTLLAAIRTFPYIQENGLGSGLRGGVTPTVLLVNAALLAAVAYGTAGAIALPVLGATLLAGWLFGLAIVRRLGGFTGDVYGALIEGSETFALLAALVLMNNFAL
ncbi:adenosylcobinamide-GDP ribazoletransferase [Paenibacillaceae bacterium WGS1546]|uniref:adenosylcobinamide-GDP ribazoletransferase n=1 Tax=Cohnella sp. WGS1546 TaxID=3366810 RepID=UPI00372D40F6